MDDLENCTKWVQDPEVVRHVMMEVKTLDDERVWLEGVLSDPNDHVYIIIIKDSGKAIGTCAIHEVASNELLKNEEGLNLGIMIGEKEEWGKGYGAEAIALLAQYSCNELNAKRVWLTVDKVHKRGIRAYEKAGFKIIRELDDPDRIYSDNKQYMMEISFAN